MTIKHPAPVISERTGNVPTPNNAAAARNVSLYPEDLALIHQYAKDKGQTFSGGLRLIIREWAEMKKQLSRELDPPTRLHT